MVLVNNTNMSVSVIKKDRSLVTLKPQSHMYMDESILGTYPSFIEVYTDEEFNAMSKKPSPKKEGVKEEPKVEEVKEEKEEPKNETKKTTRRGRKKAQPKKDETKEDK